MAGNKKLLVQFEDGQRGIMNSSSLFCVFSKEEVDQEANGTVLDLPKREADELLTIDEDSIDNGDHMFEEGMYLSVFY